MDVIKIKEEKYVFISYHSKYYEKAFAIRALLEYKKIPCWVAPYNTPDGYIYDWIINEAVDNCTCFLLLEDDEEKEVVNREMERAISCDKTIVTMQLHNLVFEPDFKFNIYASYIAPVKKTDPDLLEIQKLLDTLVPIIGVEYSEPKEVQEILNEMGAELEEKFAAFIREDEENPPTIIDKIKNFFAGIFCFFENCEYDEEEW